MSIISDLGQQLNPLYYDDDTEYSHAIVETYTNLIKNNTIFQTVPFLSSGNVPNDLLTLEAQYNIKRQ